jgi:hypothetical protein
MESSNLALFVGSLLQLAIIFLGQPAIYAVIGTTTARILAQTGYSKEINGVIAWFVLIFCAVGSAWAGHLFLSNDPVFIFGAIVGAITLLLSGALHVLRPYLIYLDWVEAHVFNVVLTAPAPVAAPAPGEAASDEHATAPLPTVNDGR